MSLMLDALKRIEAKQTRQRASEDADPIEPAMPPAAAATPAPIESPPALPDDVPPSLSRDDFTLPEPVSLEATIDRLQAFASAADCAGEPEPEFTDAEFDAANLEAADLDAAEPPVITPVAFDPYAVTAEQILGQLPQGRGHVLLFTSPVDGQGKTTTLAQLAPHLAQCAEGEVLVVDANFHNPDMARRLAVAPTWRLSDVVAGAVDWATAVEKSKHQRVSLLPGGTDDQDSSPGRNIQGVSRVLRELAGHYDLVVVDGASLARCGTAQLAAICDGVYLVVRLGEGSRRVLGEAAQVVQSNGGRLMGCVVIGSGSCGPCAVA